MAFVYFNIHEQIHKRIIKFWSFVILVVSQKHGKYIINYELIYAYKQ
jgi:hypothetical protein